MSVTMQMQRPTAEQLDLLNDHADSTPTDRVFVVFYGKHDFNMVSQSRINMSFEDGMRKCKPKKGSALEVAVNEAINHIRARVARLFQTRQLLRFTADGTAYLLPSAYHHQPSPHHQLLK